MTTQEQKRPLSFTATNIGIAKELARQGLTYRQIAARLNRFFYTAVKHENLTQHTIANLLQAEKNQYTDSDVVHNPPIKALEIDADHIINAALQLPDDEEVAVVNNDADAKAVLASNLPDDLKLKLITQMLTK